MMTPPAGAGSPMMAPHSGAGVPAIAPPSGPTGHLKVTDEVIPTTETIPFFACTRCFAAPQSFLLDCTRFCQVGDISTLVGVYRNTNSLLCMCCV